LFLQIGPDVKIARAGSTAEPFHRTTGGKIGIQLLHAERYGAGRLISIEHDHRAHFMRSVDNCLRVLEKSALKKYVRKRNEQRGFVDCGEQSFEWNGDAVVRLHRLNLDAAIARVRFVDVHHRRKVKF
jgi:hypothetical protein